VADKFGRFLHDRRQIFVGRFYWQRKLANFIVRLTSALGVVHTHAFTAQHFTYLSDCNFITWMLYKHSY